MRDATGASFLEGGPTGELTGLVGDGHDPALERLFVEPYQDLDPTRAPVVNARPGVWRADDRLLDPKQTSQPEYVNEFATLAGIRWFRGGKLYEGARGTAFFSVQRPHDGAAFRAETLALLGRLHSHLGRVARLRADSSYHAPARAAATIDLLRVGVCMCDSDARLLHANPAAQALLATSSVWQVRHGQLVGRHPQGGDRLRRALAAATRVPRRASSFSPNRAQPDRQHLRQDRREDPGPAHEPGAGGAAVALKRGDSYISHR